MITAVKNNIRKIRSLCKTHSVEAFALFGSAARDDFNESSDIDFVVRFSPAIDVLDYADNYFDLLDELKTLLKREVDLVSEKSLKNPILIQEINNSKIPLYES